MASVSNEGAVRVSLGPTTSPSDPRPVVVAAVPAPEPGPVPAGAGRTGDDAGDPPVTDRRVLVDGQPTALHLVDHGRGRAILVRGDEPGPARHAVLLGSPTVGSDGVERREVVVDGWRIEVEVEPERRAALRERARRAGASALHGGPTEIHATIPGRVVSVPVGPGDTLEAGQQILVVEAMKMQNELRAPREGTVRSVAVAVGTNIEVGDLLLVIE